MTTKEHRPPYLFSYILRIDDGAAPNPFWGQCTLTICKPKIRKTADIGDWVIGTGSKRVRLKNGKTENFADYLVYAMRVTDKKSLNDYDIYCKTIMQKKIPKYFNRTDWRLRMGDCIYDYSNGTAPIQRIGVHKEKNVQTDVSGLNALLSNDFYYFGDRPILIPAILRTIIKKSQGHKKITDQNLVLKFEYWITQYKKNKLYGQPQLKYKFQTMSEKDICNFCSAGHLKD
jgi:hypothetical protein